MLKKGFAAILMVSFLVVPILAGAQDKYPTKAIEMVVAFPAGGSTDVLARLVAKYAPKYFDKPLVVINKPGGGGITGTESVVRSKPDGYTIGITGGDCSDYSASPDQASLWTSRGIHPHYEHC